MVDKITIDRIAQAHPKVREELLEQYTHINENLLGAGVRLRFAYVYRSPEEQHQLFLKRPVVTHADSWQSIHQYGLAFDIVLLLDKDGNGTYESVSWDIAKDFDKDGKADWSEIRDYLKSKGWSYGGDWKSLKDYPHFEKTFGLTNKLMKAKIDAKNYKEETVGGIKIKYINI